MGFSAILSGIGLDHAYKQTEKNQMVCAGKLSQVQKKRKRELKSTLAVTTRQPLQTQNKAPLSLLPSFLFRSLSSLPPEWEEK
jgi:hypothetical protein